MVGLRTLFEVLDLVQSLRDLLLIFQSTARTTFYNFGTYDNLFCQWKNTQKMGNFRCKLCQRVGFKGFSRGFFKFPTLPKRQKIRDQWLKVCELTADTDTRKLKICFRHFKSSEIEEYDKYLRINPCKTFYSFFHI